jgi:hypothetical protein
MERIGEEQLIFKTQRSFGWLQVVYVHIMLVGIFGVIAILLFGPLNPNESKFWAYLLLALLLFPIYALFTFYPRWSDQLIEVAITGDKIVGETVFGKKKEFKISEITTARKHPKRINIQLENSEDKYVFNPNLDFLGFLLDYIFLRNPNIILNDAAELRKDYIFWSYTREAEFNTKYPDGYLDSFIPHLKEQKEYLMKKGILEEGIFYGNDRDPLFNPNSLNAKIDDWVERNFSTNDQDKKDSQE